MKNILVISREFPPSLGGAGIAMYNYIKKIDTFKFHIISYFSKEFGTKNIVIKKMHNPFGFTRRYSNAFFFILSSILNSFGKYDLIIGNAFIGNSCGVISKLLLRKPLLSIVHDIDYLYGSDCKYNPINKLIRKTMFSLIFRYSDKVIVPNAIIKKEIGKIFGSSAKKKTTVITLGVDLEEFERIKKHSGKKIVLFVGAVRRNKGLEYLIKSFKEVSNKIKDVELWIAGSIVQPDYHKELQRLSKNIGVYKNIKFLGPIQHFGKKNVFSYYDICDVFVVSSYHSERFGIPCVEASIMGKPIVATDIFEENGVVVDNMTALVVPRKRSEDMGAAIIELLTDKKLRERLGNGAREHAKQFETSSLSKRFEEEINILLNH